MSSSETPSHSPVGDAYAAGSSRRTVAHLVKVDGGRTLNLIDSAEGAVLTSAKLSSVQCEPRLGRLPSTVVFPCGWCFRSHDHDKVDAILRVTRRKLLHHWEAYHPRLVLVAALAMAVAFAVWRWGLGVLVTVAVALTPEALPPMIDDSHVSVIDRTLASPSRLTKEEKEPVQQVFDRLKAVALKPRFGDYTLVFRNMPTLGPNALALPGGTILISDQLVKMFPDLNVIAGVLGHEIAHVAKAHGLKQVYHSLGTYLLVSLIVGDVGPLLEDMLLEGGLLLSLSYSRQHEGEADRVGIALTAKAGYKPEGLILFFEKLMAREKKVKGLVGPLWLSSHPASHDRILEIRRLAKETAD